MQTLHTVLKHGGLFSDWELLPPEMFHERLKRLHHAITLSGDDAWLIYGDAQRYGDVAWISHFVPRLRSVLVLVPNVGHPTVLASIGSRDVPASKILTWIDDLRPFTRLPGEAVKLITERKFQDGRIGLVGVRMSMPILEWEAIADGLPDAEWANRDAEYAQLRRVKDHAEDTALRHSAAAVQAGLDEAERALQPGRTLRAATAQIDRAIRYAAAEDIRILVATGANGGPALRPSDERPLVAGDTVLLELQVEVQRYWTQAARTFTLGTPTPKVAELSEAANRALAGMSAALRENAPAALVAEAARATLGADRFASASLYGLGAGMGLDALEPPLIASDSTDLIPGDGAIALHVVLQEDGASAIAGDTILLRKNIASSLFPTAKALA